MKTYSFAPETKTADRSWETRWTKKFPKANSFIQSPGIIDLPPEHTPDLTTFIQTDYAALETKAVVQASGTFSDPVTIDAKTLAAWLPDAPPPRVTDEPLSGFSVPPKLTMKGLVERYAMAATGSSRRPAPAKPEPEARTISSYLHSVYEPGRLKTTVGRVVELMTPHLGDFDAIAFRGSSGAAVAYPLSYVLGKPLIHIRKELGHTYSKVEGMFGAKRVAIVDDFVCSGETLRILWQELVDGYEKRGYSKPVLAHLFLYSERGSSSEGGTRGQVGEILEGCQIHIAYDPTMF